MLSTIRRAPRGPGIGSPRARTRAALALFALLLAAAAGCSSTELSDVDRAKKITRLIKSGEKKMNDLNNRMDLNDPRNAERALSVMKSAAEDFSEAVRLDQRSSSPRIKEANCLQIIGLVHSLKRDDLKEEVAELEKRGAPVPAKLRKQVEKHQEGMTRYLQESNQSYLFYARNLNRSFPNPSIFDNLRKNYELLEDWENAIQSGKTFIQEAQLRGEARRRYEVLFIEKYQRRQLEDFEDEPS